MLEEKPPIGTHIYNKSKDSEYIHNILHISTIQQLN